MCKSFPISITYESLSFPRSEAIRISSQGFLAHMYARLRGWGGREGGGRGGGEGMGGRGGGRGSEGWVGVVGRWARVI